MEGTIPSPYKGAAGAKNLLVFFAVALGWTWLAGFIPVWLGITGTPLGTFIFYSGGGAPSVAGLALVLFTCPKAVQRSYFARCFSPRRAGVKGFVWPLVFFAAIAVASVLLGVYGLGFALPGMEWLRTLAQNPLLLPVMLLLSLVSGPLNEEFGWRGYALDRLLVRFGFLRGSLLLGLLWSAWHLPWFFTPGQAQYQMLQSSLWQAGLYVLFNTLLCVAISYVYVVTNRSILAGAFTHMMSNFLTSQLLVPFGSDMRAVVFSVSSLFCLCVLLYTCRSKRFARQYAAQTVAMRTELGVE